MKILHTADIHIGAKNSKLPSDKQMIMKSENLYQIEQLFILAIKECYDAILICGDLFHTKSLSNKTINFFFDNVKKYARPVIYIKGNHDEKFDYTDLPENFIYLNENRPCFEYQNVVFWTKVYKDFIKQKFDKTKKNLLLLHGNIENQNDNDYIDIKPYLEIPFDYIAMGHIHQYKIFNILNKPFVYSGSLLSNGFDECGDKGFVKIEIEDSVKFNFIAFAKRRYMICESDITNKNNMSLIISKVKEDINNCGCKNDDLVRVILKGYFEENTFKNISLLYEQLGQYFYIEIVDKSKLKIDIEKYKNELLSFKAELINLVENQEELDEQQKSLICQLAIEALKGDDLSI